MDDPGRAVAAQGPGPTPDGGDPWLAAIADVLGGGGLRLAMQPIVDLVRGVTIGYEALSRFERPPSAPPDVWFAHAKALGLGAALDALAVHLALGLRRALPGGAFLSVNVDPAHLTDPDLTEVFRRVDTLDGLVVELTERAGVEDYDALSRRLHILRERGARVTVDDVGSSEGGVQWLTMVAPEFVRLDRSGVVGIDTDETKRAVVEMLRTFAGTIGAQVVAEGIERQEELDALVMLGVPLGQGFLLGRPSLVDWCDVDPAITARLQARADRAPATHQGTVPA